MVTKVPLIYSSGILLYKVVNNEILVFLAHAGGPYWADNPDHSWGIPKGRLELNEDALEAAYREFEEEIGFPAPEVDLKFLGEFEQRYDKHILAYYAEAPDFEVEQINSNLFDMEWPKGSGEIQWFPEMDDAQWFEISKAYVKVMNSQKQLLTKLEEVLKHGKPRRKS